MFLKKGVKFPKTLSSRLILSYTLALSIFSVLIFMVVLVVVKSQTAKEMDGELIADLKEYQSMFAKDGKDFSHRDFIEAESESHGNEKVFYRIFYPDGQMVFATNLASWKTLGKPDNAIHRLDEGEPYCFENIIDEHHDQIGRSIYGKINDNIVLQMGMSLAESEKLLTRLKRVFFISLIFINFCTALFGNLLVRKCLAGLHEITRAAQTISKRGDLNKRVSIRDYGEEIKQLSNTFNTMLDRIQQLVGCLKDITNNIAHDLKSPIARIRAMTELTLINDKPLADFKDLACDTIDECDRLMNMVHSILDLAEAEAGTAAMEMVDIDLADIILDACELFDPVAEQKDIELRCSMQKACMVRGNMHSLQRLVANLIDNAIKYTKSGGTVEVSLIKTNREIKALFKDNGIGIAADDLSCVFDRFYRCDKSRSGSGIGLGLSLARIIALNHDGDITVKSEPGIGTEFVLTLPLL